MFDRLGTTGPVLLQGVNLVPTSYFLLVVVAHVNILYMIPDRGTCPLCPRKSGVLFLQISNIIINQHWHNSQREQFMRKVQVHTDISR